MEITAERHTRNLFCLLLIISAYGAADIVRIGPDIQPIVATIDSSAGSTFLVNDVVLDHGVLFAFSAFFVNTSRVRFQVWRPYKTNYTSSGATFRLVFQAAMTPSVSLSREDFYIVSSLTHRCPVVQSGDTVGVYFESSPTAISRYFDPVDASTYRNQLLNLSVEIQVNDVVAFDTLRFPYKLNLQAWIDTSNDSLPLLGDGSGLESDYVDCPNALIPSHVIETITISPGMTGATGPKGPPGDPGMMGATGPFGVKGDTGPVGLFGSTGAAGDLGATGATGSFGFSGVMGPEGRIGDTGLMGATGSDGATGPVGPPGPPGTSAPVENQAASSSDGCTGFLMSENFLVGVIIWLVLLSLLLLTILVIIVALCFELRSRGKKDNKDATTTQPWTTTGAGPTRQTSVKNDYHHGTMATNPLQSKLREETESNFSLDTIETAFNESDMKSARKSEEPQYAVLRDPSTTSISDRGVYNPVYTETASDAGDSQPVNGVTHAAHTSS